MRTVIHFALIILVYLFGAVHFVTSPAHLFSLQHETICNIKDYGAIGDGRTVNTTAINKAITTCAKDSGTVVVPKGKFVSGTIVFKSNVTLYLEENARIIGTDDLQQYKSYTLKSETSSQPIHLPDNPVWFRALVLLDGVQNATVTGFGTIDGNSVIDKSGEEGWRGPHGILIGNSRNIEISNIRVSRSGNYNILGIDVVDIKLKNLTITEGSDGIHIRRGKNIDVENCKIYTRDDAIAGGYWEDMTISNCLINSSCNGIRLIFPATNLEIRDTEISGPGIFGHRRGSLNNPLDTQSLTAILLQPGAWGVGPGKLDQVSIKNIRIRDVRTALSFILHEGSQGGNISVENVTATGIYGTASSIESWAKESKFQSVSFKNASFEYRIRDTQVWKVRSIEQPRTESRALPFWGLYARNVKKISLEDMKLTYMEDEARPVMGFDGVDRAFLNRIKY